MNYISMKNSTINRYFNWLGNMVDIKSTEEKGGFYFLLKAFFKKEFYWTIDMDENRAEDGKALRSMFAEEAGIDDISNIDGPCNVLEMMIGLARRWDSQVNVVESDDHVAEYFWIMVSNLGLDGCTDDKFDVEMVNNKLDILLERGYKKDGEGGLFVIKHAESDLSGIEIWYQLQQFLMENYDF